MPVFAGAAGRFHSGALAGPGDGRIGEWEGDRREAANAWGGGIGSGMRSSGVGWVARMQSLLDEPGAPGPGAPVSATQKHLAQSHRAAGVDIRAAWSVSSDGYMVGKKRCRGA